MSELINALLSGNTVGVEDYINDTWEFLKPLGEETGGNEGFKYMGILWGTLVHFSETYDFKFHNEDGEEYPYIEMTPKNKTLISSSVIIMIAVKQNDETLVNASKRAIDEIKKRKIFHNMINDGFMPCNIKLYGLGCYIKDCAVRCETAYQFIRPC